MAALINRGFSFAVAVVMVVAAAQLVGDAAAATYVVGDASGWMVPTGGPATYTTWASQYVFRVGDVLVFNFGTGIHDVARVTKDAFDTCTSTNPIAFTTVGPASFTLNSTGPDYYTCTFGQHCSLGQKLSINVLPASSTTTTPTPSPAPLVAPTPPTPSPAPLVAPTPAMPSPSPSPESSPSPAPSGTTDTPPSSPAPSPSLMGDMSPPPPPSSSAEIVTIATPFVVLASFLLLGFVI
ncbi:hypothetical protein ABFS82_11G044000 [Erythranthe guttata]|uniref:cucumber peeling cupredoxin-like n=1 Tax=Erythranthe guttata TaxID=4155 RepID=UPI00064DDA4C|nr:PREDICTED: cucumber peeling cupredoxin-like [Erythranthe guttata]|eukprot:XP_012840341.1 PREDICTED: cucumber peeling cupredoxin-like [Erythranthe guttata]